MSSSSPTAPGSRSLSPETPDSSCLEQVAIQNGSPWFRSMHSKSLSECAAWELDGNAQFTVPKDDESLMLRLDDLIQEHAYDDSSSSPFDCTIPKSAELNEQNSIIPILEPTKHSFLVPNTHVMSQSVVTKPIPPPPSGLRKRDSSTTNQRVVYPPKESCFGLRIMVPSIPEGGTKSRVETQIRVTIDLADASATSGDPYKYDRIGSWKWLKLPSGTATKRRTRKQGKIDPVAQDILHLTATVTCASPPQNRVLSCSSCQTREAKRVARKVAARVRPTRSDSDSLEDFNPHHNKTKEDTTSIIQFNCAEILDFSTGSVVLPLRITCYCRHHREKVGFNIHFTMMDRNGRVVGTGMSRPIMITDDHKTSGSVHRPSLTMSNGFTVADTDWHTGVEFNAPSKRKQSNTKSSRGEARKRAKPYDTVCSNASRMTSREASVCSLTSPTTSSSPLPATRSPTPPQYHGPNQLYPSNPNMFVNAPALDPETPPAVASDISVTTHENGPLDISMPDPQRLDGVTLTPDHLPSPLLHSSFSMSLASSQAPSVHAMPFLFFNPSSHPSMPTLPLPKIHRLIPACGPTHGGIEVTVLGSNFHPSIQLNCVFGDVPASSTQRWSDNTLVCVLPPRAAPGVVAVWFEGFPKDDNNSPPSLFTYSDESDRALMELALQVVGLKMTGKIEDAKNVAMRIVGNAGDSSDSRNGMNGSDVMQLASFSIPVRDIRQILLSHASDSHDFESLIVRFLSILDTPLDHQSPTSVSSAISHQTTNGQTLLHLASFLGFSTLVRFLVLHHADVDVRDRNGYTALHFAVLGNAKACAKLLVEAGADMEIVNILGKTPQEEAPSHFFTEIMFESGGSESETDDAPEDEDEEARWGDGEEDSFDGVIRLSRRSSGRRSLRRESMSMDEVPTATTDDAHVSSSSNNMSISQAPLDNAKSLESGVDEKQTASFVDMIQRTLAQLHAQGIIPNIPQFPLPQLPGMPAVPWGALPQFPVVFPIFVPMPGWAFFLGEKRVGQEGAGAGADQTSDSEGARAVKTAHDWVTTWEKWMAITTTTSTTTATTRQQNEDVPPPVYTPRAVSEEGSPSPTPPYPPQVEPHESSTVPAAPLPIADRATLRRVGYDEVPVTDQEVNAYAYQPTGMQAQKLQKKKDRMLVIFWLPILLLSLLWAFHSGIQFVYRAARTAYPLKALMRA